MFYFEYVSCFNSVVIIEFKSDKCIFLLNSDFNNIISLNLLLGQRFGSKHYDAIQKSRRNRAKTTYKKIRNEYFVRTTNYSFDYL